MVLSKLSSASKRLYCRALSAAPSRRRKLHVRRTALGLGLSCAFTAVVGCGSGAPPAKSAEQNLETELGRPIEARLQGNNVLKNPSFEDGALLPWRVSFTAPAKGESQLAGEEICLDIGEAGSQPFDVLLGQSSLGIVQGHQYQLQFKAKSTKPARVQAKIAMAGPPYSSWFLHEFELDSQPKTFTAAFEATGDDSNNASLTFNFGGPLAGETEGYRACLDDIQLLDPKFEPGPGGLPPPKVLVNQLGYLPKRIKLGTIKNGATEPLDFELRDAEKQVVLRGKTALHGVDPASGDHVHVADFSAHQTPGSGYVLAVGEQLSLPFDISTELFSQLRYDALAYFYHNRSGIEISMPYAGQERWTRPAGHLSDKSVPCAPNSGCDYSLDVSGGWYDAGDHGKYVVNGGISVWTLLNQYERLLHVSSGARDFADGKLNIPEMKNGVPDLLDEVRWQVEFMLKMQVPPGKPKAGMVHHKIHDVEWTSLPLAPHEDTKQRYLRPPSTTATLNLAAVGAQAARIWRKIDPTFSKKCLAAAQLAWKAAATERPILPPMSDDKGGGPYNDINFLDEAFWAASELYITTGHPAYLKQIQSSRFYKRLSNSLEGAGHGMISPMTWQWTHALGTISLGTVPSQLPESERAEIRAEIVRHAGRYHDLVAEQGYRLPMSPVAGKYPWGSNSFLLNNMIVLGLAYDFSKDPKYLDSLVLGMDYLLGRNPLAQSYVTGYGERALMYPHHRFWAHQLDEKYPLAPPGAVSGGPNSDLQDPYAKKIGLAGCAPQKCFVDHIEAWSVNEITINWNAPFAWVAALLHQYRAD